MKPEAEVQADIRLYAGSQGILLWRNNNGACEDKTGRLIRYGLGNDSAQVQRRIKSSDLIGVAAFVPFWGRMIAVEVKEEGWRFPESWRCYKPDDADRPQLISDAALRVLAQWRFLTLVHNAGGLAGFAQSVDDFKRILQGELVLP